ncbi:hypothetical protein [Pedobacter sp.]|uniref:hypothetical protein n=1 Tax=Pedobacter sp. TaxID=1411316 RepID=UPI003BAB5BC9
MISNSYAVLLGLVVKCKAIGGIRPFFNSVNRAATVYFGETDHVIPWQTDHLNCWRTSAADAIGMMSKVMI